MAAINSGCILKRVLFIACLQLLVSAEYVPVFVWESSSDSKTVQTIPALTKINSNEFKSFINEKLQQKHALVVFVEENLSVEDFSWQDSLGRGSFPKLQVVAANTDAVTYFPNVHSPLHILDNIGKNWQHTSLLPDGLDPEVKLSNDSLLFINLVDATENEDRPHLLKKHDKFMTETYENLVKLHEHVTAVYTARYSSWSDDKVEKSRVRAKREASERDGDGDGDVTVDSTSLYNGDNNIYLYTSSVPLLLLGTSNVTLGTPTNVTSTSIPATSTLKAQLRVEYEAATLTFNFYETSAGYWGLTEVTAVDKSDVSEKVYTLVSNEIEAPYGFSYHCSQKIQFSDADKQSNSELVFKDGLQVQPFLRTPTLPGVPKFDDAYDCVYFFTIPILAGIFVTIIFAWIMGFGICMIMDIKTMDRFDDPKGKSINVNVLE